MFSASKSGQYQGYQISRSVRLRSSASAYFSRTPGSAATDGKKITWSAWVKRGSLSATFSTLFSGDNGGGSSAGLYFDSNGALVFSTAAITHKTSPALFRDPSAWYHILVVGDTTDATGANRLKLYVNGVQQTWTSGTDPTLNAVFLFGKQSTLNGIGFSVGSAATTYFDGYLTEINFIDGQALTPSSFGAYNAYGVWSPMKYNGTYGNNGFYLNFSDNSAATAAAIGKDYSGNGNNWTPNNISVTAGATYDSMLDVPTPWADGGNNRGNYTTLNPLKGFGGLNSSGNLNITNGSSAFVTTIAAPQSGKWYFEFSTPGNTTSTACGVFARPMDSVLAAIADINSGSSTYYRNDGALIENGSTVATYTAWSTGANVIGVALDMDAKTIRYYLNNTAQGASARNLLSTTSDYTVSIFNNTSGQTLSCNYGQRPFSYTPPSGFLALNTLNLPTPTIANGANYFAATTYTGTGASRSVDNTVNGVSFQPDFVWVKGRSGATDHALYDAVRGVQLQLESNTTAAETTETTGLTAFNSNGFTVGALAQMNTNTATYVGWQWKAGGTPAVTNTAGSITSTVSVGATQGFSVVTYTANASQTIGHGLGVAPRMIIIKSRQYVTDFIVYHASLGNTGYVALNQTNAFTTNAGVFNNTSPTSSVFTIGSGFTTALWGNSVAYCFAPVAGFSAFGSYTGNGSADGPFVFCGFRPRFVLVKVTSAVDNWWIQDTSRSPENVSDDRLFPNLSNAEAVNSVYNIDFLSNGFKVRGTGTATNDNGATYIFAAFAENPFKYSLAR